MEKAYSALDFSGVDQGLPGERFFIVECPVSSSCRQIKLLQALVSCCGVISSMVELNSTCC